MRNEVSILCTKCRHLRSSEHFPYICKIQCTCSVTMSRFLLFGEMVLRSPMPSRCYCSCGGYSLSDYGKHRMSQSLGWFFFFFIQFCPFVQGLLRYSL